MKLLVTLGLLSLCGACVHMSDVSPSYVCGDADLETSAVDVVTLSPQFRSESSKGLSQLRRCYEADLKRDHDAKGAVRVVMNLDGKGAVTRACVTDDGTDYVSDSLHACLLSQIRAWQFSRPLPTTPVHQTFVFDPLVPIK